MLIVRIPAARHKLPRRLDRIDAASDHRRMRAVPLSQIRGHRLQVRALQQVITGGRMGHAYLFEGTDAVGKRTLAWSVLARLACWSETPGDACGLCRSCRALQRGDHPDLVQLERDGTFIKIDQVREATARLKFEPVLGKIKGVLIDGAEGLKEEAANALLKTLEEPPPNTVFFLVTSRPQLLLPTIRSRCQVLRFGELASADLATLLQHEGHDPDAALAAAALAEGSLTAARALCDPDKLRIIDAIAEFAFELGSHTPAQAGGWTERLAGILNGEQPGEAAGRADFGRSELLLAVDALRAALRDAMLVACGHDPAGLPHARHAAAMRAMAARCDPDQIAKVLRLCESTEGRMNLNLGARMAWTELAVESSRLLGS